MENLPFLVLRKIFGQMENLNGLILYSLACKHWIVVYEALGWSLKLDKFIRSKDKKYQFGYH